MDTCYLITLNSIGVELGQCRAPILAYILNRTLIFVCKYTENSLRDGANCR